MRTTVLTLLALLMPLPTSGQECSHVAEVGDQVRVTQRRSTLVRLFMAVSEDDGSYGGQLASVTADSLRVEWSRVGIAGGKSFALADVQRIEKRCHNRPDRVRGALRLGVFGFAAGAVFGGAVALTGETTAGTIIILASTGLAAGIGALLAPSSRWVRATIQPVAEGVVNRGLQVGFKLRWRW